MKWTVTVVHQSNRRSHTHRPRDLILGLFTEVRGFNWRLIGPLIKANDSITPPAEAERSFNAVKGWWGESCDLSGSTQ